MPCIVRAWNVLLFVGLMVLVSVDAAQAQRGAITLPLSLTQLTNRAAVVVHGRVSYVHVEPHPQYRNFQSVVVALAVLDTMKGSAGKTVTFRQFIWDPRDLTNHAGYRVGDEVVLFLNPVTAAGFTSPVGLQQGRFQIVHGAGQESSAIAGATSATLYQGLDKLGAKISSRARQVIAQPPGPLPLSVLQELVRVVAVRGGTN